MALAQLLTMAAKAPVNMYNQFQMQNFLKLSLEQIKKHKLNPNPENYKVWYEYSSESSEQLNREIDELIVQQIAINEQICRKLFQKYFVTGDEKDLDATRLAFTHLLNIMIGQIANWTENSDEFCEALKNCTDRLNNNPSIAEIKEIITELTTQTLAITSVSSDINEMLSSLNGEVAQLRKDLEAAGDVAVTDSLTGIYNRRGLDENLAKAINEEKRQRGGLSIIMIDIDHFKAINDNFGHTIGDKILKLVATIMKKNLRGTDFIARYGGEEFTVILPETKLEGAIQVAEHIRKAISAKKLSAGKETKIGTVTISLGVTQYKILEDQEELIHRADQCMYEAKRAGRNLVKSDKDMA